MIYGNTTYATLTGGTTQNAYEVRFGYQVLSEDIPNNRRQVRLQLEVRSVKSNYYTYGFNQTSTIDGTTLSSASFDMRNINVWQVFGSRTITINGAYSGTKTGSFTTDATTAYGNYTLKSGSASVYISLATLHQAPVIDSITVEETRLSGVSNDVFVANLSQKIFTISATTYDSANITSYKIYQNNSLIASSSIDMIEVDYMNIEMYYALIDGVNKTPITVQITDSMGASTTSTVINYTVVPYINPSIITTSSYVKRNGQMTGKAKLNLIANSYQGNIGNTTNSLALSFTYWAKDDTESTTYYTIPSNAYSISGNTITLSNWNIAINGTEITDLLKENTYYFKIKIQDSYKTSYGTLICSKGEWLMAKFKDRIDFQKITINGDNPFEYTTTERVCGIWTDGKTIYGQYVPLLITNVSPTWANAIDITDIPIDTLVDCIPFGVGNKTKLCRQGGIYYQINGNYIQMVGWDAFTGFQYAWIEYTKTSS